MRWSPQEAGTSRLARFVRLADSDPGVIGLPVETGTNRGLGGALPGLSGIAFGPKCLQQIVFRRSSFKICVSISESSPWFVPLSNLSFDEWSSWRIDLGST
jgi:hypothetical protein